MLHQQIFAYLNSRLSRLSIALVVIATIGYHVHRRYLLPPLSMSGQSVHEFRPVAREFKRMVESRQELGAGFAVHFQGQPVLEMTAGHRDLEFGVPWTDNTLAYGMSIAKSAAAMCMARLVESGLVSYGDLVATHWPEFAQSGKENVTVRQLLSHQAGLFALDAPLKLQDLADNPPAMAEALAKQAPGLPIGTFAYHGLTFGLYIDQLVRRIDPKGRAIQQFFHEEIARPAKVEAYIGLSRYQFYRLARVHFSIAWNIAWQLVTLDFAALKSYLMPGFCSVAKAASFSVVDAGVYINRLNDPEVAVLPFASVNLVTNAPSLARLYSLFTSNGSIDGAKILGQGVLNQLADTSLAVSTHADPVTGFSATCNAGFAMRKSPLGSTMIGHLGFGGQMVWSDPEHSVTVAYLTNHLRPCSPTRDAIHNRLIESVYQVVAKAEARAAAAATVADRGK